MSSIVLIEVIYVASITVLLIILFELEVRQRAGKKRAFKELIYKIEELQEQKWETFEEAHRRLQIPFPLGYYTESVEERQKLNSIMIELSHKIPQKKFKL